MKRTAALAAMLVLTACSGTKAPSREYSPEPSVDVDRLALEIAWDDMTRSEQADLCEAVASFGPELAARIAADGNDVDPDAIEAFLEDKC